MVEAQQKEMVAIYSHKGQCKGDECDDGIGDIAFLGVVCDFG